MGLFMFKENTGHLQKDLFGFEQLLTPSLQKSLLKSKEYHFYHLIFRNIDEKIFSVLYSKKKSRPNAPINAMVAALLLMQAKKWTYEQLFEAISFNLLTKVALGLHTLNEQPFCPSSLFNFQNRLNDYFVRTGRNLLEVVFDALTEKQLKQLKLKTSIQRVDSFQAASNIRNYSRIQLLVEMLIRLFGVLSKEDQEHFKERFLPYTKKSSGQYIYRLQADELSHELEKLAEFYGWIHTTLWPRYSEYEIFQAFERVYTEHFTVVEEKVTVKSPDQLSSGSVQSPDDLDATYREKRGEAFRGQVVEVAETAHPHNPINLITDVAISPNNVDDSGILQERLPHLKEKTPELEELHLDGAYGSEANDKLFEQMGITAVQTGIRGRKPSVPISIIESEDNGYDVSCPYQQVRASSTRKRFKAEFDPAVCSDCSLQRTCPTRQGKHVRVYYFTRSDYLVKKRQRQIERIPVERRKLRNNVEATVKEFTCKMSGNGKKLKVRGAFKTAMVMFPLAMAINFGRIYRYIQQNPALFARILFFLLQIVKEQLKNRKYFNIPIKSKFYSHFWKLKPLFPSNNPRFSGAF